MTAPRPHGEAAAPTGPASGVGSERPAWSAPMADRDGLMRVPFFAGLSDDDLDWMLSMTSEVDVEKGDVVAAEGTRGDSLYVVLSGELDVLKRSDGAEIPLGSIGPGEIVGEMAVLESAPRMASIRAATDSRLLQVDQAAVLELLRRRPESTLSMIRIVMERLRSSESALREREKLAGLGTLSAGLAHELNNPAAAVRRSSELLHEALDDLTAATRELGVVLPDRATADRAMHLADELSHREAPVDLDPLDASDLAVAFEDFLEARGVPGAGDLAPTFVSLGWTREDLERVEADFPGDAFGVVVRWIGASAATHALIEEVSMASRRISEIVAAVKEYAFMDQGPVQRIDLRRGIENTLIILRSKTKAGIEVVKEFAPDLPEIEAYGGELNQVWTNILDNAIDAMHGKGTIRIAARPLASDVVVEICDDGPGMPPEVRARIFEPFFTTKPPGVGTGLGLHISYNVVRRHHGRLEVRSRPGETCFTVTLPQRLAS